MGWGLGIGTNPRTPHPQDLKCTASSFPRAGPKKFLQRYRTAPGYSESLCAMYYIRMSNIFSLAVAKKKEKHKGPSQKNVLSPWLAGPGVGVPVECVRKYPLFFVYSLPPTLAWFATYLHYFSLILLLDLTGLDWT